MRRNAQELTLLQILDCIRLNDGTSRVAIARTLGISRATVTESVRTLLSLGLVNEDVDLGRSPRNVRLHINPTSALSLGIDLSGSTLKALVVDRSLSVQARLEFPQQSRPDHRTPEDILFDVIDALLTTLGPAKELVEGIGIAIPGLLSTDGETVIYAAPYDWHNVALSQLIRTRYGIAASIVNDTHAMLLAEQLFFPQQLAPSSLLLFVGEGIGGKIFINGQIITGAHGFGGEWGHIVVKTEGAACQCGKKGCMESEFAIPRIVQKCQRIDRSILTWSDVVRTKDQSFVQEILFDLADTTSRLLVGVVTFLDPQKIILQGPITEVSDVLIPALTSRLAAQMLSQTGQTLQITTSALGSDAAAIGAAATIVAAGLMRNIQNARKVEV